MINKCVRKVKVFTGQPCDENVERNSIDGIKESIKLLGYAILPPLDLHTNSQLIQEIDQSLVAENKNYGADNLERINDLGVVRNPFLYNELTRKVITDETLLKIIRDILGFNPILHVNRYVVSSPEFHHPASVWHREPPYNNFIAQSPSSITVVHLPNGSSKNNAGLNIIPGSHRWPNFPSDFIVEASATVPEIIPGGILVFDSNLFHRGGDPATFPRRSVVTIYTTPTIKQQTNIATNISKNYPNILLENSEYSWLFGVDTNPKESDAEYRNSKLKALKEIK